MSKKRIKSFHNSVNKEFKRRIENIFPLIPDNKVRNFSSIITWDIVQANLDKDRILCAWNWGRLHKTLYTSIEIE